MGDRRLMSISGRISGHKWKGVKMIIDIVSFWWWIMNNDSQFVIVFDGQNMILSFNKFQIHTKFMLKAL